MNSQPSSSEKRIGPPGQAKSAVSLRLTSTVRAGGNGDQLAEPLERHPIWPRMARHCLMWITPIPTKRCWF